MFLLVNISRAKSRSFKPLKYFTIFFSFLTKLQIKLILPKVLLRFETKKQIFCDGVCKTISWPEPFPKFKSFIFSLLF